MPNVYRGLGQDFVLFQYKDGLDLGALDVLVAVILRMLSKAKIFFIYVQHLPHMSLLSLDLGLQ